MTNPNDNFIDKQANIDICNTMQKKYERECKSKFLKKHSTEYFLCQQIINSLRKCQINLFCKDRQASFFSNANIPSGSSSQSS